jgi:twitching motility two-component system response regulator PilH
MMSAERILIVEDDDYLRKASEIALRRAGFTVISAPTGRDGLNLARSERPALIIMDLLMPQPTGLEILRTLRGEPATKTTPVMVISNSSMQRVVDEVQMLGGEYIVKADLSLKELAGRVEKRLVASRPAGSAPAAPAPAAPASQPPAAPASPEAAVEEAAAKEKRILPAPKPVTDDEKVECAGCGKTIGINNTFCPKCGRQLSGPTGGRTWRPVSR